MLLASLGGGNSALVIGGLLAGTTVKVARGPKRTASLAFKNKLERLVNLVIRLIKDRVPKDGNPGSRAIAITADVNPVIPKENEQWNGQNRSSKKSASTVKSTPTPTRSCKR